MARSPLLGSGPGPQLGQRDVDVIEKPFYARNLSTTIFRTPGLNPGVHSDVKDAVNCRHFIAWRTKPR